MISLLFLSSPSSTMPKTKQVKCFLFAASNQSLVVVARRRIQNCHHILQHKFPTRSFECVIELVHLGNWEFKPTALHALSNQPFNVYRVSSARHQPSCKRTIKRSVLRVGHTSWWNCRFKYATRSLSSWKRKFGSLDQQQDWIWILFWWCWRSSDLVGQSQNDGAIRCPLHGSREKWWTIARALLWYFCFGIWDNHSDSFHGWKRTRHAVLLQSKGEITHGEDCVAGKFLFRLSCGTS